MTQQQTTATNHSRSRANISIGKTNLPTLLNEAGIRLIHCCNRVALKFVGTSTALNCAQRNYFHNLKYAEKYAKVIEKIIQPRYKKIKTKISDIKSWCLAHQLPITPIPIEQQVSIAEPKLIDPPSRITHTGAGVAQLPDTYLAEIHDAMLIAGSNLILTDAGRVTLNDEIFFDQQQRYDLKNPYIQYANNNDMTVNYLNQIKPLIQEGIHFCNDYSYNYYHWLIECLPRLYILDQFPHLDNVPLLIDEGLTAQQLDALKIVNSRKHPLITLKKGCAYSVKKLMMPVMPTVIHYNYYSPVAFDKDVLISPTAIHYVRNTIFQSLGFTTSKGFRKLYISRKQSDYRRLLNLEEIERFMVQRGFEIVFPEALTFANQVKLFSQAQLVVGQSGAGITNLMFCPENCKALILINHHPQTSYYLFSNLAQILNIDLQFIPGTDVIEHVDQSLQNDFTIAIETLSKAIDSVLEVVKCTAPLMN